MILLGAALVAPFNALTMIDVGKSRAANLWCTIAIIEILFLIVIEFREIWKKGDSAQRGR